VSWRIRLAFGVGQYAEGVKGSAFSIFLLFYYTSIQNLSGTMAGVALLIALCFDGVTDPLMGSISDAFKSRWGRRHPFMYGSAIPFALSFFLLFSPPSDLSEFQLFLWLTFFAILTRGLMTVYSVPHMAMNAELTNDYTERTTLSAIRVFFSLAGYLSVAGGGFAFFFRATEKYSNGQLNPAAYPIFALVFASLMVLVIWLSALGTHSEIPRLPQPPENIDPLRLSRLFKEIKSSLQIQPFRRIIAAGFLFSAMLGTMLALVIFGCTYFWGMSSGEIGTVIPVSILGVIVGTIITRPVSAFIGEKKQTYMVGMVWFAVFSSSTILLRLVGFFPANGHWSIVPLVTTTNAIAYMGWGVCSAITASMIADLTDEHERVHRVRQEGIYYGASSLMAKVASGFGSFAAGIITDISGVAGLSDPVLIDPAVILRFGLLWGPLPLVVCGIAVFVIRNYDIDHVRHAKILQEIDIRKSTGKHLYKKV